MLGMILFSLLAIAIIVYIGYPLLRKSQRATIKAASDEGGVELLAEQDRINLALADLDFEYECGRVSDEDYQKLRQELLQDAESVLARIETDSANQEQQVEDTVEAEIARYKKEKSVKRKT